MSPTKSELEKLARREHPEPHAILGAHPADGGGGGVVVRAMRPSAQSVSVKPSRGKTVALAQIHPAGIFEGEIENAKLPLRYKLKVDYGDGGKFTLEDPYAFLPTLGELDLHLMGEGRHERLYDRRARARNGIQPTRDRNRVCGVGPGSPRGQRGRRLQLLGRASAPDALDGHGRDLGAVPARGRRGRSLQVRDPHRR
jgi:hypothetical protein